MLEAATYERNELQAGHETVGTVLIDQPLAMVVRALLLTGFRRVSCRIRWRNFWPQGCGLRVRAARMNAFDGCLVHAVSNAAFRSLTALSMVHAASKDGVKDQTKGGKCRDATPHSQID